MGGKRTYSREKNKEKLFLRAIEITRDIYKKHFDAVVFLDNSARPLSWIIRTFWKRLYPNEPFPRTFFINPGGFSPLRGLPYSLSKHNLTKKYFIDTWLSKERIMVALERFKKEGEPPGDIDPYMDASDLGLVGIGERFNFQIDAAVTRPKFNANHIGIIDDFFQSGRALVSATVLIQGLYPEAEVEATVFFPLSSNGHCENHVLFNEMMPWCRAQGVSGVRDDVPVPSNVVTSSPSGKIGMGEIKHVFKDILVREAKKFPLPNELTS